MYVKDLTAAFYDHKNQSKKSFLFYDHAVEDLIFGGVNKKVYFFTRFMTTNHGRITHLKKIRHLNFEKEILRHQNKITIYFFIYMLKNPFKKR